MSVEGYPRKYDSDEWKSKNGYVKIRNRKKEHIENVLHMLKRDGCEMNNKKLFIEQFETELERRSVSK